MACVCYESYLEAGPCERRGAQGGDEQRDAHCYWHATRLRLCSFDSLLAQVIATGCSGGSCAAPAEVCVCASFQ